MGEHRFDGSTPVAEFCERVFLGQLPERTAIDERRHARAAINHLGRFLERPALVRHRASQLGRQEPL